MLIISVLQHSDGSIQRLCSVYTWLWEVLTCSSEPSAVTMVTEWAPCVVSSWAGMVMVVPSWVTIVIVPPMACKSASEILTWCETTFHGESFRKSVWTADAERPAHVFSSTTYLLLGPILLCYQGDVLLTNQVWALHRDLLWAGVLCLHHRCRVADAGVIDGVWEKSQSFWFPAFHIVPLNGTRGLHMQCVFPHCTPV